MRVFCGNELKKYLNSNDRGYKARDAVKHIIEYLRSDVPEVLCLYGLYGTGKTVMMQQAMMRIDDPAHTLFISFEEDAYENKTFQDLRSVVAEHQECKYIFVDEVTKVDGFINCADIINREFIRDRRIVLSGENSLAFDLAKKNSMFEHIDIYNEFADSILYHVTYMPYDEYRRVCEKNRGEYIRNGGRFERYDISEYLRDKVASNIVFSLANFERGGAEYELIEDMPWDYDEIKAVLKTIWLSNLWFLSEALEDDSIWVWDPDISFSAADNIVQYLTEIDFLYHDTGSDRYIITQPWIRYEMCREYARQNKIDFSDMSERVCSRISEDMNAIGKNK